MTLAEMTPGEVAVLWQWISENPELHQDDYGPKTLEEFRAHLDKQGVVPISVREGKKLVGAIGFAPETRWIRGIHFRPDARGRGLAYAAVKAILKSQEPHAVRLKYMADNPYMPGLVRKLGGVLVDGGWETARDGKLVPFQLVEFNGNLVTAD